MLLLRRHNRPSSCNKINDSSDSNKYLPWFHFLLLVDALVIIPAAKGALPTIAIISAAQPHLEPTAYTHEVMGTYEGTAPAKEVKSHLIRRNDARHGLARACSGWWHVAMLVLDAYLSRVGVGGPWFFFVVPANTVLRVEQMPHLRFVPFLELLLLALQLRVRR